MKKKTTLSEEDQALFRQLMAGTRKIKQDTIVGDAANLLI
ncbi:hypothetical protein AE51_02289 [Escherichia coli BIDMC 76]|nr:hypothetical protein AE51_02289 [Escherichia coli BIDMC 76]